MSNLRQAAQQALEALKDYKRSDDDRVSIALHILHQALAEPEQPVAWYFVRDSEKGISFAPDNDPAKPWQPLYTAPPRATEPVAWMVYTEGGTSAYVTDNPSDLIGAYRALPLYTAPTPRKPLTDEEIYLATNQIDRGERGWAIKFARAIERAHGIGEQT